MKDLTKGPIHRHLFQFAAFIALSTLFQTLYLLVDMYFVGWLGKEALAGVSLSGNITDTSASWILMELHGGSVVTWPPVSLGSVFARLALLGWLVHCQFAQRLMWV